MVAGARRVSAKQEPNQATFVAGIAGAVVSSYLRSPRIVLLVPAVLITIPGATAFRALVFLNDGQITLALANGAQTASILGPMDPAGKFRAPEFGGRGPADRVGLRGAVPVLDRGHVGEQQEHVGVELAGQCRMRRLESESRSGRLSGTLVLTVRGQTA